ncbi:MAG: tRNA uridine-5-carboxymethylaminomethyl(34) synthesis GTPase MnmE [Clostridia bacterium]|nr:tRNA uridine-5-carboxymethylaminomethyl(34) synthesis GTPase MnmE [Clostridia bacterium]
MYSDTIAAVSTAPMKAGISVIRVSGNETKNIIKKIFFSPDGKERGELEPRRAYYGLIKKDGRVADDVLLTFFAAPHSYTGEDSCEIGCHGGTSVTALVLSAVFAAGAVQAGPGEFTRRAVVNGRMSLSKAEGIARLLDAPTDEAAFMASSLARGALGERLEKISEKLLKTVSSLYAAIDYPEEDMEELSDDETRRAVADCADDCRALIDSNHAASAVMDGVRTVIAGKPNAGKSSLFNLLIGEEKAIVTSAEGTTRDVIEYPVKAGRVLLRLCDTAGLREKSRDAIELIGIERAKKLVFEDPEALVLALFDGSAPPAKEDIDLCAGLSGRERVIPVVTKSDAGLRNETLDAARSLGEPSVVSSVTGEGKEGLLERIEALCLGGAASESPLYLEQRQLASVRAALDALTEALDALDSGLKDAAGASCERALGALTEADGRGVSQKIVDDIFSRFCVGK